MLFVALYTRRPGVTLEQVMKVRVAWKPPKGSKVIGEYWLQHYKPNTIAIFEADNIATIMEANGPWQDLFKITVVPAISGEEGVKLVPQLMSKR